MTEAKIFSSAAEALAYQLDCDIATLEWYRFVKKFSQADIRRQAAIVRTGLANCRLYVTEDQARAARAHRVVEWLRGERNETGESDGLP